MPPRSRQTRNQEAASRRQGGILDLDPTDGLPVQKYAFQIIQINQDASSDAAAVNTKSTNSAEWAAQFNTSQYPWPEAPLPSFQKELSVWNQEMIRRARAGNTSAKLSVWDRRDHLWMSASEATKRASPLKSLHLNNLGSNEGGKLANGDADSNKSDDEGSDESSSESEKSGEEEDEDEGAPFKTSMSKRRKLASRLNEPDDARTIEVRKWVQLPSNIAEKAPERSFLATRRPGMPPLYTPEYAQKLFGQYHSSISLSGATGYDLGEGGGLSNASGVLGAGTANAAGTATPPRKNIPPRRKKKKLGGPGRRKANPNPKPQVQTTTDPAAPQAGIGADGQLVRGELAGSAGAQDQATANEGADGNAEHEGGDDNDNDNESGSEAEGSEEGEIDESGGANAATAPKEEQSEQPKPESVPQVAAPEVTITDADMQDAEPSASTETIEVTAVAVAADSPKKPGTIAEMFIPGLGEVEDKEEKQIVEENAQAVSSTAAADDVTSEQGEIVSEAVKEAAIISEEAQVKTVPETADAAPAEEVDLLGAMDAAIDRGMSEGA